MTIEKRMRVFAGPNGSGKSTMKDVLPTSYLGHYLNPDDIERQLNESPVFTLHSFNLGPFDSTTVRHFFLDHSLTKKANMQSAFDTLRVEASALFFDKIPINSYVAAILTDWLRRMYIQNGQSFTFETVMSSVDKIDVIKEARLMGFRIYFYYVATDDPAINLIRVRSRVAAGGHNVPPNKIEERYYRSLTLLRDAIRLSDRAYIFDNSAASRVWIAEVTHGTDIELKTEYVPTWFVHHVLDKAKQ